MGPTSRTFARPDTVLYLCIVLDLYSAWQIRQLVMQAVLMAVWHPLDLTPVILYSNRRLSVTAGEYHQDLGYALHHL